MLEERSVLKVPMIPEEKIHGITGDEAKKLKARHHVTNTNKQSGTKFGSDRLFGTGDNRLFGRKTWWAHGTQEIMIASDRCILTDARESDSM